MIPDGADTVRLLGLDFGSTTSSALLATASIRASSSSGRMEFSAPRILYRSPSRFTPFAGEDIDVTALGDMLDEWLRDSGAAAGGVFAGGAIVTGLAARAGNAQALRTLVRARVGDAVMATADDPRLESWLAFMGSCATLSRAHPGTRFINLDIGGGTTNAALGIDGEVIDTACHFIGARHLQFAPGSYHITAISPFGRAMLSAVGVDRNVGEELAIAERDAIIGYCIDALNGIVDGSDRPFSQPATRDIEQSRWAAPPPAEVAITFSGGVGELVYQQAAGEAMPGTTHFGDLGIDLAAAILRSPRLAADVHRLVPENRGRATCYGITLHSTEISGTTLFLPQPAVLPLTDIPILGRLGADDEPQRLLETLALARSCPAGAALHLDLGTTADGMGVETLRRLGERLSAAIAAAALPAELPLVLLVNQNVGKALGQYATGWGRQPFNLIVIDEVPARRAHFVNLGRLQRQVVPVSFYGLR
jgi:ethanolamine utilization protein EutA